MRTTPFAGLTALDAGESIASDGGKFTDSDRDTIDHFLELGARSHRHDEHVPLADPTDPPIITASTAGGTFASDTTIIVGFTRLDDQDGETLPSPFASVTTAPPIDPPEGASAVLNNLGGNLVADTYYYVFTLLDGAGGETTQSEPLEIVRTPGAASAQIVLSGLASMITGTATQYRIYRAKGQQDEYDLLLEDTAATFTDDGSTPLDCGNHPPAANTTNSTNSVTVTVGGGSAAIGSATLWRLYLSIDGDFTSPSLYGSDGRLPAEAGTPIVIPVYEVDDGAPPDVSTAVAGATMILASDIDDLYWRDPVANVAALPASENIGEVRMTLDTGVLWTAWPGAGMAGGAGWSMLSGGGGGGGSAAVKISDSDGPIIPDVALLTFVGSGGTGVRTINAGGGSATVEVSAPSGSVGSDGADGIDGVDGVDGTTGAQGLTGSAIVAITDNDGPQIPSITLIEFVGSGGTGVRTIDLTGGSARVEISGSAGAGGGAGPPGASGAIGLTGLTGLTGSAIVGVTDNDGPRIPSVTLMTFVGSGGTGVRTIDNTGGSATVEISASGYARTRREQHTWAVGGQVNVPVGSGDFIPPMFASLDPGSSMNLAKLRYRTRGGSATVKLVRKTSAGTQTDLVTGIAVNTTSAETALTDAINDNDEIRPEVTAIAGSPDNISITLAFQRTVG